MYIKNEKLWFLCIFYFLTFRIIRCIYSIFTKFFSISFRIRESRCRYGGQLGLLYSQQLCVRLGGWLGDKFNPFKILIFVFIGLTTFRYYLSFMPSMNVYTFGCLLVAFARGLVMVTIFKNSFQCTSLNKLVL